MISTTELKIFKDLEGERTISDLSGETGLDSSTVSKYVSSSIDKGNGLFEKRREGKNVHVKRADTSHSNLLKTIQNEYPRWKIEELFSHSRLRVAGMIMKPKRVKDIVFLTRLSRQYVRRCLKELAEVGIVIKDEKRYGLNTDLKAVVDFVVEFYAYINEREAKALSSDSVILWQRGEEFLFKTPSELDEVESTAVSRFYEFDIPLLGDKNYYFKTEREMDVKDVIIHTILIDENSVTYNTYASLLYLKEKPEHILERARVYDIEEHLECIIEFLKKREKVGEFLPTWEEFIDLAEEYEVSL